MVGVCLSECPTTREEAVQPIVPNLWFDGDAEDAANFYVSLFPGGRIISVQPYGPDAPGPEGETMYVEWEVLGQRFGGINGGPQFSFSEACSFEVRCDDQSELDHVWDTLADGGEPGPCGWIKDRYGLSWQVTPTVLTQMMDDPDPARVYRATRYFLGLDREQFDIAALQAAYDAQPAAPR